MNGARIGLLFCVGFNISIMALCAWGYSVTGGGAFAATGLACLICGASASAALKGIKAAQTAKGKD